MAALGGDQDEVAAILGVGQRIRALDAALGADMVQQQGRGQPGDSMADEAVGEAVDLRVPTHDTAQDRPRPVH